MCQSLSLHRRCDVINVMQGNGNSTNLYGIIWCVYDKDHMSALRIKNTSESDPLSYEVTSADTNKAQKAPTVEHRSL